MGAKGVILCHSDNRVWQNEPPTPPPGTQSFTGPGRGADFRSLTLRPDYLLLAAGVATPVTAAGAVGVGVAVARDEAEDAGG